MAKKRGKGKKKSKFAFNFDEFDELAEKLDRAGGSIREAADRGLKGSHAFITPNLAAGIARHHRSGETGESLDVGGGVVWENPLKAHVNIGFNLKDGGVPSIFLMWGTPKHGNHPGIASDGKLKNAAFGAKVKREVANIQRREMEKALQDITRG